MDIRIKKNLIAKDLFIEQCLLFHYLQYLGKWTYEFLTLGQPISNELNTKILIEYLKGIGDVEGWALINYPNSYEQMAMLEKALTGHEILPDPVNLNDVEDIDPLSPRIVFEGDKVDTFAICRRVRLFQVEINLWLYK